MGIYVVAVLYIIFIIVINIVWNDTYQKMNKRWDNCCLELTKKNLEIADKINNSCRDITDVYRNEILEINKRLENLEKRLDIEDGNK